MGRDVVSAYTHTPGRGQVIHAHPRSWPGRSYADGATNTKTHANTRARAFSLSLTHTHTHTHKHTGLPGADAGKESTKGPAPCVPLRLPASVSLWGLRGSEGYSMRCVAIVSMRREQEGVKGGGRGGVHEELLREGEGERENEDRQHET